MSPRIKDIIIAFILVVLPIRTYQLERTIRDVESSAYKLSYKNRKAIEVHRTSLDLEVLDSCGIITDGSGFGSLVAIGPNILLTAGHNLESEGLWVEISEEKYEIESSWGDDTYDVGFIRIKGEVPYVELGEFPKLLDEVYLVGSPYSLDMRTTITKGIVSHLDRSYPSKVGLIQTDAEAAPGSSGGPLFSSKSEIVGVAVSIYSAGGGVTLCVSVKAIREAYDRFLHELKDG